MWHYPARRPAKAPTIVDTSGALEKEVAAPGSKKATASSFRLPALDLLVAEKVEFGRSRRARWGFEPAGSATH